MPEKFIVDLINGFALAKEPVTQGQEWENVIEKVFEDTDTEDKVFDSIDYLVENFHTLTHIGDIVCEIYDEISFEIESEINATLPDNFLKFEEIGFFVEGSGKRAFEFGNSIMHKVVNQGEFEFAIEREVWKDDEEGKIEAEEISEIMIYFEGKYDFESDGYH